MDDERLGVDLKATALHEAGHAVVNLHYGVIPNFITLEPSEKYLARVNTNRVPYSLLGTLQEDLPFTKALILQGAHVACAGVAAETFTDPEWWEGYSKGDVEDQMGVNDDLAQGESDYDNVMICLRLMLSREDDDPGEDVEFSLLFEKVWDETVAILQGHWPSVEAMSQALVAKGRLEGDEILEIWEATEG